jgi:hypothetical protein
MSPPDNLIDQIHYDICHGKLEGDEIRLTAEQMASAPKLMGKPLVDGRMLLGKTIRLSDEPNVKFPPDEPFEPWVIGT